MLTLTDRLGQQIPRTLTAGATSSAITLTAAELGTDTGQLSDGSITVSAVATDAAGNSSLAGSFSFTLDTTASAPSITLGNGVTGVVSQAEAIRAGGVIRVAADAGDQIRLTFTDSATPSHSVTRSFTAAGAANPLGIVLLGTDLAGATGLANGPISVRAEAIDAVGNTSSAGTFSFDLDTTPTVVPSIGLGAGVSGAVSRTEALLAAGVLQVQVAAADIGSWVELTLTDKLGNQIGRNFTATGTSSAITLAATDLGTGSGKLSDGNISVTARATDPAGNSSASGSFSFTLDTAVLPPAINLGSGVTGDVSKDEATRAAGVLQVTTETGSTVVLTFTPEAGHGSPVTRTVHTTGAATSVAVTLDPSELGTGSGQMNSGQVSVSAVATDAAGNVSTAGSFSFTLDIDAPAAPSISLGAGITDIAGVPGLASRSKALQAGGVLLVNADSGSQVEVTLTDRHSHSVVRTVTATSSATASAITLAASDLGTGVGQLDEGSISVSAVAMDAAGNRSTAGTTSFTLDSQVTAPAITLGTGVSGDVSQAEATLASGVVQVTAESGSTVVLTFTDTQGDTVQRTVTATSAASAVTLAASELGTDTGKLGSGRITISAVATDAAGNVSEAGSFGFTLDLDAPNPPGISLGNGVVGDVSASEATQAGGVLQVSAESGSTVNLTFTDVSGHSVTRTFTAGNAAGNAASAITLAGTDLGTGNNQLSDGSITVSATATDAAGNKGQAGTFTFTLDRTAPAAATVTYSNGVISVAGEQGSTISLTLTDAASPPNSVTRSITLAGTTAGTLALTAQDLTALADGTISFSSSTRDAAGNSTSGTGSFTLDESAIQVPAPNLHLTSAVEDGATRAEALAGVLEVGANSGHVLTLTLTDRESHQVTRTISAGSSASTIALLATELATELGTESGQLKDGTITVTAVATDGANHASAASTISFILDTKVLPPAISLGSGVSDTVSRSEATQPTGVLQVTTETGSTVVLTFTPEAGHGSPVTRTVHTTGAATSVAVTLASSELGTGSGQMNSGQVSVSAVATDAAGNVSTAGSFSFTLDIDAPAAPSISLGAGITDIAGVPGLASRSKALQAGGVLLVNADSGSQVEVTLTDRHNHSVVRTVSGTSSAITLAASDLGTGVGQLDEGSISVSAVAMDAAGNRSTAGTTSFTLDSQVSAPAITLGTGVSGDVSQAEATLASGVVQVTAESGSTVVLTFTDAQGDTVQRTVTTTATASAVTLAASELGTDAGKLGSGRITISAVATDAAGNVSEAGSFSFTMDLVAPNPPGIHLGLDAPATPDISLGTGVVGDVSASEATQAGGVLQVSAESGSTVHLTFTDGLGHSVTRTFTAGNAAGNVAGNAASAITLAGTDLGTGNNQLSDGSITVSATATDAAGNRSTAGSISFTLDSAIATPSIGLAAGVSGDVSKSEATLASGVLQVTAESGSTVVLTLSDIQGRLLSRTVTAGASASAITLTTSDLGTDIGQLQDGTINVTSVATDVAGNRTTAGSFSFTLNTQAPDAPVLEWDNAIGNGATQAEASASLLGIYADSGSSVLVTFTDANQRSVTRSFTGLGDTAVAITLAATEMGSGNNQLGDGSIQVSVTSTDAVGNSTSVTSSFQLDTTPPDYPVLALTPDLANGGTLSETSVASGLLGFQAESGSTVNITFTDSAGRSFSRSATGNGSTVVRVTLAAGEIGGASGLADGTITVTAQASDAAGNRSAFTTRSFTLDTAVPLAPVVALRNDSNLPGDGITSDSQITISGLETATGTRWRYSVDGGAAMDGGSITVNGTSGTSTLQGQQGVHSYEFWQIDKAGNESSRTTASYTIQEVGRLTVALAQDTGASNQDSISTQGLVQVAGIAADSVWRYRVDDEATTTIGGTPSATGTSSFTARSGQHTYTIWQTDSSSIDGPATTLGITLDNTPPATGITGVAAVVTFNASEFGTAKSILPASWTTADADVQSISLGFNAANANTGLVRDLALDRLRLGSQIFDLRQAATGSFSYPLDGLTSVSLDWAVDDNSILRLQRSDGAAFTAAQLQAIDRALSFQTSVGAAQGNRSLQWSMSDVAGNTSSIPIVVAAISEPPTLAVAWQAGREPAAGVTGMEAVAQPLHHALVFNGHADSYAIQTGLNLHMRKSLTVQAWINPASLPASGLADIMDISGASHTDRALLALDAQGRLVFQLLQGEQILTHKVSTQALALHSWQHVAVTVADNGELAFWINGQRVASGLAPSNAPANTDYQFDNVVLGHGGYDVLDGSFMGAMRDVRLYDAVASDAQIQSASQDRLDAGARLNLVWSNSAELPGRDFPASTTTLTSTLTLGSDVLQRWQDTPLVPLNSTLTLGLPVSTNRIKTIRLAFDGLADGSHESLLFQGQPLTTLQAGDNSSGASGITFNGGVWDWSWNLASHSLTLTFRTGGTTSSAAQSLVQALAYRNDSSTPTLGQRQFSLSLTDLLGNASTTALTLKINAQNNNDSLSVVDLTTTQNLISITQGAAFGLTAPLGAEVQILWQNGGNSLITNHIGTGTLQQVGLTQQQAIALGNGSANAEAVNVQVWTRNANGQAASGSDSFNLDIVQPAVPVLASSAAGLNSLDSVTVSMAEAGTVYLVRDAVLGQARNLLATGLASVNSLATLTALPDDQWNQLSVLANTPTAFSLQGLAAGTYHLFAADAAGNLSNASANTVLLSTASVLTVQGKHSSGSVLFSLGNETLANGDSLVFSFAPENPVDWDALPAPAAAIHAERQNPLRPD